MAKPSIPIPGALDLRVLQQAIGNIAERLRQADAQIALLSRYASSSQSQAAITLLQQQVNALASQVSGSNGAVAAIDAATVLLLRSMMPRPESATPVDDAQRAIFDRTIAPRQSPERPVIDAQALIAERVFSKR